MALIMALVMALIMALVMAILCSNQKNQKKSLLHIDFYFCLMYNNSKANNEQQNAFII